MLSQILVVRRIISLHFKYKFHAFKHNYFNYISVLPLIGSGYSVYANLSISIICVTLCLLNHFTNVLELSISLLHYLYCHVLYCILSLHCIHFHNHSHYITPLSVSFISIMGGCRGGFGIQPMSVPFNSN